MVHFGVKLERNKKTKDHITSLNRRLESKDTLNMMIEGFAIWVKQKEWFVLVEAKYIMGMVYFWYSLLFIIGVSLALSFISKWLIIPGVILAGIIFGLRYLFFILTYIKLRKKGYKGKIKILGRKELVERLARWVKEKS